MRFRTLILALAGAAMLALIIVAGGVWLSNIPTKTYLVEGSAARCYRTIADQPSLDIRQVEVFPAKLFTGLKFIPKKERTSGLDPVLIGTYYDKGKIIDIKHQRTFEFREPQGSYKLWFLVSSSDDPHEVWLSYGIGSTTDAAITFSVRPNRVNHLPNSLDCASVGSWSPTSTIGSLGLDLRLKRST